ncbi:MAG TPA: hypothetical protein VG826_06840 [Pirellulales bacterium]|nr:hypothetical protein [Pirellulales bacterium]
MNAFNDLEERLDQLGRELAGPPCFVDQVMADVAVVRRPQRRWLRAAGGLALAASLLIAAAIWLTPSPSLYAQAIAALDKAKTVHVTGWTSEPLRKWPLEGTVRQEVSENNVPVDAWYWNGEDRRPRSYERFGPVTLVRDGAELREYQSDVDLLFVSKGLPKDYVERFSSLSAVLEMLRKEGAAADELETRNADGKTIRGLKFARGERIEEYWFDAKTNLPTSYARRRLGNSEPKTEFQLRFAYDEQVPAAVAAYRPPQAKHVRYGGKHDDVQIVWKQHVQELAQRMLSEAKGETVSLLPRTEPKTFSLQYMMRTPDERFWVVPLDLDQYRPLSVKDFIRVRVSMAEGDHALEAWRVQKDLLGIEFPRADLVCEKDTPWQQWVSFALKSIDLEFVDVVEERTYWIAKHDGRKLKPYQQVKPPVPYIVKGGKEQKGLVKPGVGYFLRPVTMHELLSELTRLQNDDLRGRGPIIIDETGLPRAPRNDPSKYSTWEQYRAAVNYDQYLVATDSPYFVGEESQALAREWYEKEFGVTFEQEQREATIHVVRRKP